MLFYLINASLIWLLSLIFFDVFLKKETFHRANRFFLLSTLLLGLLLPLVSFSAFFMRDTIPPAPAETVQTLKRSIAETAMEAAAPNPVFTVSTLLGLMYVAGVLVTSVMMGLEIARLLKLYKTGVKTRYGNYTLIETHQDHGPFSWGKNIFVASRKYYSAPEMKMIIAHEMQHVSLYHILDKILFTLLRIIFWFHPLIHIYYGRLMMVHEYEADNSGKTNAAVYGSFLVTQTLLRSHNLVSHSFNFSPIKKRIAMLTKQNSPRVRLIKYALMIPMLLVFLVCCTERIQSQTIGKNRNIKDNKLTFGGNQFEFSKNNTDTIVVMDPTTGKESMMVHNRTPSPILMNGQKIYPENEVAVKPRLNTDDGNVGTFLFKQLKADLKRLQDGQYSIDLKMVVDKNGKVTYYDPIGIRFIQKDGLVVENSGSNVIGIEDAVEAVISDLTFTPAKNGGNQVASFISNVVNISVSGGQPTLK
ncbi:MAG TPA: M56 family metallopeptidase [Flavipsychrobacter sp.]|nr:M56 family metallopeptidase [Flavipsychrobacter sp.]